MSLLSSAFNYLLALQGKECVYKRKSGSTYVEYTVKVAPSNYSRKEELPSDITVRGREYVIPLSSLISAGVAGHPKNGDVIVFEGRNEIVTEVLPMADLGGTSMGFRVRVG